MRCADCGALKLVDAFHIAELAWQCQGCRAIQKYPVAGLYHWRKFDGQAVMTGDDGREELVSPDVIPVLAAWGYITPTTPWFSDRYTVTYYRIKE